jgi:DNA replication ATP-dependent helicase Dna2
VEGIEDTSSRVSQLYAKKTGHLTDTHCDFFRHWENLISLEEQDIYRFRQELWSLTARDRETGGRCFADMILADGHQGDIVFQDSKSPQYIYRLCRSPAARDRTLLHGHLHVGDPISLSIDPNLLMLARGFITELTSDVATVVIDRELSPDKLLTRLSGGSSLTFRIDKDELSGGIARMRENLALLFYANSNPRRRSLLVDLAPPTFDDGKAPESLLRNLNDDQVAAVTKVLNAKDYALILGMPGTGKTMTIAAIIKLLVARKNTVLLASYTHSAVDNIVLKLLDADLNVLRVGNVDKVHSSHFKNPLGS